MEPKDDPEARIRELERPLLDVARTSELGVGQYNSGATYPTMPPAYGAPNPYAPAPRRSAGFRPWWLIAGLIVFGVVVIVGGVVVYGANMVARDAGTSAPKDAVVGGGGSIDEAPVVEPGAPGGRVTVPPPGAPLSVSGIEENKAIVCNASAVSVSGVSNTVTITGDCVSLTVSGVENSVIIDAVDTISASGFDNRVTYRFGSPEINSGGSNVVERG